MTDLPRKADAALTALVLLLPGVLLALLGRHSGGFFPDWSAVATLVLLLALLLRTTLGTRAFAGAGPGLLVAGGALTAFVAWVLVSGTWSDAWSRSVLEYSRDLGYLVALVLFGLLGRAPGRARVLVLGLAAGAAVVCVVALVAWLRPDLLHVTATVTRERLNWPLGYWNTAGLVGAFGGLWCVHLTCADPSRLVRVAACLLLPACVAVVYYSVSRGAAAAAVVGLVAYLVAGTSRGMLTGLPVALGTALGAIAIAHHAGDLNVARPSPAALQEGRDAAVHLVALGAAAAVVRALLLLVDARLARISVAPAAALRGRAAVAGVLGVAALVSLPLGGTHGLHRVYDNIFHGGEVPSSLAPGERFRNLSLNSRVDHWQVALDQGYAREHLRGTGAGTYALLWDRGRTTTFSVVDAHSLYLEVLGELGLVGLALLVIALLSVVVAMVRHVGGPEGTVWGALLATTLAWALRAGIDWDWEMPAATLWVLAAGGLAVAAPVRPDRGAGTLALRVGVGLGCLLLALLPLGVLRSQTALNQGVQAFRAGDCARTVDRALASSAALGVRPEPFELLAWCDVRLGQGALARQAIAAAIRRDPGSWELHYDDALVRAATGLDPMPAILRAQRRNPLEPIVLAAIDGFRRHRSVQGRARVALRAPVPLVTPR